MVHVCFVEIANRKENETPAMILGIVNSTVKPSAQPKVMSTKLPNMTVSQLEKPKKFKGGNFKLW